MSYFYKQIHKTISLEIRKRRGLWRNGTTVQGGCRPVGTINSKQNRSRKRRVLKWEEFF